MAAEAHRSWLARVFLPPWLSQALVTRRMWKNWIKCMVAVFIMLVLTIAQRPLDRIGNATFFGLILIMILPPFMPVSIYLYALSTLGIGMLVGWAWGCIAMVAANHNRDPALLQRQVQSAQAAMVPDIPHAAQMQQAIFGAQFLDTRASAIYGAFIFIGAYLLAILRAIRPKMALLAIFGTIVMDLMMTIGPLFPQDDFMLGKILIIPGVVAMACNVACEILFFPQSMNHATLGLLVHKGLAPLFALLKLQDEVVTTSPSDHEAWTKLASRASSLRAGFVAASAAIEAHARMLQLEISRGRIGAGDLGELVKRTRDLGARAFSLGSFVMLVEERYQNSARLDAKPLPHATERLKQSTFMQDRAGDGRTIDDLLPELDAATADLRQAAEAAFQGGIEWLTEVNITRWRSPPANSPTTKQRQEAVAHLRTTLAEFVASKQFTALARFRDLFDPFTGRIKPDVATNLVGSVRGLFQCFLFTSSLVTFSETLASYLEFLLELEVKTPKNKFQFPGRFVHNVVRNANDHNGGENEFDLRINNAIGRDSDETARVHVEDVRKHKERVYERDPDALMPHNNAQRLGRKISRLWKLVTSPNGSFAFRYALISVALWIPAVCPSSAKFYYDNRGLWALIMSQTGMGIVTGEQVLNTVQRIAGTVLGVALGIVAWYIGAPGNARGNAYGIAIMTMVVSGPFVFLRIACPPQLMGLWIMTPVTIVFVVGYSWVDNHLEIYAGNQGAGGSLAGRRALLVIIGFATALIISIIPSPVPAKALVRKALAKNIRAIAQLYGLEVTAFEQSRDDATVNVAERRDRYRAHFMKIFGRIQMIERQIAFASLEPGLKGTWPKGHYERMLKVQGSMLAASAGLSSAYSRLSPEWCARLTDMTYILNPAFTADCFSLFAVLHHSLASGTALPPIIPIFERLFYHHHSRQARFAVQASRAPSRVPSLANVRDAEKGGSEGSETEVSSGGISEQGDAAILDTFNHVLTWEACHDEQFILFSTAVIALVHIVAGLNQLHHLVLDLVGESDLEGFDLAQERWARLDMV